MEVCEALDRMFDATSVAVVGASNEPGKVGYSVVKNLLDGGYTGRIYPINPVGWGVTSLDCDTLLV